jgi:tryptophan halogenase
MALAGKFIHPAANPRALESAFDYRIAIDAAKLRDLAKHRALAAGVTQFSTKVMGTAWSDGRIRHLLLDGEQSAEVDFYLDCTGTARGLTGAAGWTGIQALPYRRETGSVETGDGNLSLATVTASPDRWTRELALRTRRVTETFSCLEDGLAHFGYLAVPWRGNCVALGRAACDLPALHAPAFSLLTRELGLLGALLPADPATARVEAREYNRRALTAFGHMRDAQALFEAASARTQGKPSPDLSDNLARKIEQFTSRGRLVMYDDEILSDSEWIACLLGLGFTPECVSPLAMAASVDAVCDNYLRFAKRIRQAVERMPDQQTYIQHMLAEYAKETGPDAV